MGRRHAAASAGVARAQSEEAVREAESRRESAERERQLLTSYLGTEEQVAGTGQFNVNPEVLKYTQRYSLDPRALQEIQTAGAGVKGQTDPFLQAGRNPIEYGQGFADQANDLLAQAEAAARAGDIGRAEQLYGQAQGIIGGLSQNAQFAFNLGGGEQSNAAVRASSTEARIVGRQLLTAQQLGDPNSKTSTELRGRLLDPSLAAIDENTRNAERAIAAERGEIEGQIRQQAASGGTGVNARAELDLRSRAASQAGFQRAVVYSEAGAQKAQLLSQTNLYLNEFAKRMAEDSVALSQEWVNGTAGVRDIYQDRLMQLDLFQAEMANQWAQIFAAQAEQRRKEDKINKQVRREAIFGFATGSLAVSTIFGGGGLGQTAGGVQSGTGVGAGGGGAGDVSALGGSQFGGGGGEEASAFSATAGGGGGGGGLGGLVSLLGFL